MSNKETFVISVIDADGNDKSFYKTKDFEEYLEKRSEMLLELSEGEELMCYTSNDKYAQYGARIFGHDGALFEYVTQGRKEMKSRYGAEYCINKKHYDQYQQLKSKQVQHEA